MLTASYLGEHASSPAYQSAHGRMSPIASCKIMSMHRAACRYDGVMELTKDLSQRYPSPGEVQQNTVRILSSLFPSWLPPAFKVHVPPCRGS